MGAWSRKGLKEKAKIRLKANYWKAVLVGLLAVLIGGGSSAASGVSSGVQSSSTDVIGDSIVNRIPYISGRYDYDNSVCIGCGMYRDCDSNCFKCIADQSTGDWTQPFLLQRPGRKCRD